MLGSTIGLLQLGVRGTEASGTEGEKGWHCLLAGTWDCPVGWALHCHIPLPGGSGWLWQTAPCAAMCLCMGPLTFSPSSALLVKTHQDPSAWPQALGWLLLSVGFPVSDYLDWLLPQTPIFCGKLE